MDGPSDASGAADTVLAKEVVCASTVPAGCLNFITALPYRMNSMPKQKGGGTSPCSIRQNKVSRQQLEHKQWLTQIITQDAGTSSCKHKLQQPKLHAPIQPRARSLQCQYSKKAATSL
jgi:hypothetical protein